MSNSITFMPFGRENTEELQRRLREAEENAGKYERAIIECLEKIEANTIEDMEHINAVARLDAVPTWARTAIFDAMGAVNSNLNRANQILKQNQDYYERYTQQIPELRRKLQDCGGPVTLTRDELTAMLTNVPNVVTESVYISNDKVGWDYVGLVMTPDSNPYKNIMRGAKPNIPLARIEIRINPKTGSLYIGGDRRFSGSWGERVHPHVLGDDKPCLGGFEATYYELLQIADFSTIAILLREFLQQANQQDTAGKQWPTFMGLRPLVDGRTQNLYKDGRIMFVRVPSYTVTKTGQAVVDLEHLLVRAYYNDERHRLSAVLGKLEEGDDIKLMFANAVDAYENSMYGI